MVEYKFVVGLMIVYSNIGCIQMNYTARRTLPDI